MRISYWSSALCSSVLGMGFSFHETVIFPGTETHIHYQNHLEGVWCIEGDGEIETIADGKKYALGPGVVYALDQHDEHWLRGGREPLRVICVFNPPLTGREEIGRAHV